MTNIEECKNKLNNLKKIQKIINENCNLNSVTNSALIGSIECFENLIEEHFDNPPLKFEELKVGMWVWDNKRKEWCVLLAFWKDALNRYYISGLSDSPFEENRFYRKQVEE